MPAAAADAAHWCLRCSVGVTMVTASIVRSLSSSAAMRRPNTVLPAPGVAMAGAKLFVDEGAHVFISGRRQEALDDAVKLIGRNVTGVQGDAADLADLDRLFDTVKREKGTIDVLWASAGLGEQRRLGEITEEHFDAAFGLN